MIPGVETSTPQAVEPEPPTEVLEETDEARVTALELFFDLVFVFAFTQVTGLMAANPTWQGLGQGMLVLASVWWSWGGYAWLTNSLHSDDGIARLGLLSAMAAMLVAALAVPGAFGDSAIVFGVAYLAVRAIHIAVYAYGAPDLDNRDAILSLAPGLLLAPAVLLLGCVLGGAAQASLWIVALVIDYGTPYVRDVSGFNVSASHFHERFGLIIIIALGESIVATGAGLRETGLTAGVVAAAIAGLAIAGAQWWAYFDVVALVAGRRFAELDRIARARLARDSYGVLHLLLIAGIVLVALGLEKTLLHVDEPLDTVPAVALCGGAALYLGGHIAFRLRNVGTLNRQRLFVSVILIALIPFATAVDAVVAVIVVAAIHVVLISYEATRFRDARDRVRHSGAASLGERQNATG
jgi:low temperature requirement protein LtrA